MERLENSCRYVNTPEFFVLPVPQQIDPCLPSVISAGNATSSDGACIALSMSISVE